MSVMNVGNVKRGCAWERNSADEMKVGEKKRRKRKSQGRKERGKREINKRRESV